MSDNNNEATLHLSTKVSFNRRMEPLYLRPRYLGRMPFKPQRFSLTETPFLDHLWAVVPQSVLLEEQQPADTEIFLLLAMFDGAKITHFLHPTRKEGFARLAKRKATGDNGEVSTASVSMQASPTFSRDGLGAVA